MARRSLISPLISDALDTQEPAAWDVAMTQGDPRQVRCPVCFSKPGEPCTTPTDNGQRKVPWFHLKREDDAREQAGPRR